MKNAVQYNHKSDCWMVLTPDREFIGSAMKERDATLFAMAHEMFDLLKGLCRAETVDFCDLVDEADALIQQIEPILSINNQEGE